MGTWAINIQGHGVHDNGLDHDAEQRLKQFVEQMIADGHEILDATITVGGIRQVVASSTDAPAHFVHRS